MFGFGNIVSEKIDSQLFGQIILKYDREYEEITRKLLSCVLLLERGQNRYSESQKEVFFTVNHIHVLKSNNSKPYQAAAIQATRTIEFNSNSLRKNGTGGLTWLLCHELYHLWDPFLRTHTYERKEANANLFANKIKRLLQKEPAIYTWK